MVLVYTVVDDPKISKVCNELSSLTFVSNLAEPLLLVNMTYLGTSDSSDLSVTNCFTLLLLG